MEIKNPLTGQGANVGVSLVVGRWWSCRVVRASEMDSRLRGNDNGGHNVLMINWGQARGLSVAGGEFVVD